MIISPLEQFNILSVYDFAPFKITGFELIYAKLLVCVWYLVFNYPVCALVSIGTFLSNDLPLFSMATSALASICVVVLNIFLPFSYAIATFTYKFLVSTNLIAVYSVIEAGYNVYHSFISFLWYTLWFDANLLYSADHLFFSKVLDLGGVTAAETNVIEASGDGANITAGGLFEANLALLYTKVGVFLVSLYFVLMELGVAAWTWIDKVIVMVLDLDTKDASYLIFSLNTSTIWLSFGFLVLTFLFTSTLASVTIVSKNRWQTLLEIFYDLILNVVNDNAGAQGRKFFPLIFTTFMIILVCNVQGMIPYSFTVTSHLIVTFSLALAIFIGINILGILKNRRHFLSLFFPPGAPLGLAPLLVFIELVSYVFRVLSLSIRLFANLMSGHTLLKILSGFAWVAVSHWGLFLIPLAIIFLVTGLELAIAFLQAYIFSVLLCIYINDAFNLH
jgi:ATP synthase subunit 6